MFEQAIGTFYCQSCGTESHAHGQDFVYELVYDKTIISFVEPSQFGKDYDSNAMRKNIGKMTSLTIAEYVCKRLK